MTKHFLIGFNWADNTGRSGFGNTEQVLTDSDKFTYNALREIEQDIAKSLPNGAEVIILSVLEIAPE